MTAVFRTRSSHVRVYEACPRKWYLAEVEGHGTKETEAMKFGTAMHLELENWLRDSKMPAKGNAPGLAALKSLKYLPAPGAGLAVEHRIEEVLDDGTVYTGAVDLWDRRDYDQRIPFKDPYGVQQGAIGLYDHKSTANLRYAKSVPELVGDISSNFYARHILSRLGGDKVYCRWVYTERVGTGCEPRDFVIDRAQTVARWAITRANVKAMKELAMARPAWQEVKGNVNECDAYGGCQFRTMCAFKRENKGMSLMALLNQNAGAPKKSLHETLKEMVEPGHSAQTPDELIAQVTGVNVEQLAKGAQEDDSDPMDEGGEGLAFGINPPDAAPPDLSLDSVEKKTRKKREKKLVTDEVPAGLDILLPDGTVDSFSDRVRASVDPTYRPKSVVPAQGSLLERIARLEAGAGGAGTGNTSLEERIDRLEDRLARIEELVGG